MVVYLASYKGTRPGWHGFVNRAIRYVTRSIYSHSEVCIGNPFEDVVLCVSASGVDKGVRGKPMQLNPEKWDIIALPWISVERVLTILDREKHCGYDYFGVARFSFPLISSYLVTQSDEDWFCSELIAYIMGLSEPWRYAPAELHDIALAWADVGISREVTV